MNINENKVNNSSDTVTISRAEYEHLIHENEWLREQLLNFKKKVFGSSSEKTDEEVYEQMSLLFNEAEMTVDETEDDAPVTEVKGHTRRRSGSIKDVVPEGMKVVEIYHDLPAEQLHCPQCGNKMEIIGTEHRDSLVLPQAEPYIRRDIYYTYGCSNCRDNAESTPIIKTPKEPPLIKGSFASPEAIAYISVEKFVMCAPLYRQEMYWKRQNILLSRQTMSNWMVRCSKDWLKPIYDELVRHLIKENDLLHADETVLQVLHEEGKTPESKSYMWLYRTGAHATKQIVIYQYERGRRHEYPKEFLKEFKGYLQTDGYQGYIGLENIINVGCLAHARRYFVNAQNAMAKGKRSTTADQGVAYCDKLFEIERKISKLTSEERKEHREQLARPVLDAMYAWAEQRNAAPKSNLGKALTYLKNQKQYLYNYLLDGRLELSNNRAERSIKPFVMARKNFLFANTPSGADSSAVVFSIIETAKENNLDPYKYITWVLSTAPKISETTENWAVECLPWKAPETVAMTNVRDD